MFNKLVKSPISYIVNANGVVMSVSLNKLKISLLTVEYVFFPSFNYRRPDIGRQKFVPSTTCTFTHEFSVHTS